MRKLTGESVERMAKAFRHPDAGLSTNISIESPAGRMIGSEIIPYIAFLQEKYPLQLRLVFPTSFLDQFCLPSQVQIVDCTNIAYTDTLFDRFIYK